MRIPLASLFAAAAVVTALSAGPVAPPRAAAQEAQPQQLNAAAVVIDTGTEVRKICVRFSEPELTGEELLRRAKVDAVFAEYSIGQAVCSLCGTGCPADDCFCESGTTGRYWNYSRDGDAGWQRSSLGASSTTVKDGDVEGWAWGTEGAVPPWIGFESICVETAEPTPKPASTPASVATGAAATPRSAPPSEPASRPIEPTSSGAPSAPATASPSALSAPPSEASVQDSDAIVAPATEEQPAVLTVDAADSGGSGLGGVLGFAGAGALLGAGLLIARRRR
jgi:hypothetical protein